MDLQEEKEEIKEMVDVPTQTEFEELTARVKALEVQLAEFKTLVPQLKEIAEKINVLLGGV